MAFVKLDAILRSNGFMRLERPPELWEVDSDDDVAIIWLIGEMIVFGLRYGGVLEEMTLAANNVVVEDEDADAHAPNEGHVPIGEFVALTVKGSPEEVPELTWRPGATRTFDMFGDLDRAAGEAGAVFAYSRFVGEGSITVFLPRAV